MVDLAACMGEEGVGLYARRGWAVFCVPKQERQQSDQTIEYVMIDSEYNYLDLLP